MSSSAGSGIVGRDAELERGRTVATLAEGPRAALIRGEPGMGKTSIWQALISAAAGAGVRVLSARGVQAEMPLAFAALADLLEELVPEVADRLAAPQRRALEAALGVEAATVEDPLILPRAVLASLRLLAEDGPVLVAVDDAQWVDRASARVVAFALRRLGDRPVATVATLRGGPAAADPLRLAEAYGPRLERLDMAPLSPGALQRLLRIRLGIRLPRTTLARVHRASGGNPMFALEFGRTARAGPIDPLTVPLSLEQLVAERVERLPPELRPLLELAAVLERPTVTVLGPAVGGAQRAVDLVEAAAQADVVLVDGQDVIRFAHPLLASAIYGRLTPPARRRLHRLAAGLVDDLEARARHVALGCEGPDGAVASLLDEAAAAAARRGGPDAAAELVEEARRLTPDDERALDERTLSLAWYLVESSQIARAAVVLDELLDRDVTGPLRAEALVLRSFVAQDARPAVAFFEEALCHCGENRPLRIRVLLLLAETHTHWFGDLTAAEAFLHEAEACAESVDDAGLRASILKWTGMIAALRGLPWRELTRSAVELERRAPPPPGQAGARIALATQLTWAGELAEARALADESLSDLERRDNEHDRAWQLPMLARIELPQGEWDLASRHAADVAELVDPDDAWGQAIADELRATVAVHRGAADEGRRLGLAALEHAGRVHLRVPAVRRRWLLGHLELSRGQPAEAWKWLEGLPGELEEMGIREPGFVPLLPDAIETLVELGETAEAERLLRRLELQATRLDHRWAIPAARRSRALVLLARGETGEAVAEADLAAAEFEARGFPLDQARALLVAGQALRRAGERRRAAAALTTAAEILGRLGAELWLARVRQELARANPRPRRDRELTHAEHRVATLVAAGRTNAEVAAQLYVTVGTVEAHLTRIYRKLDVRSRVELSRRVTAEAADGETCSPRS